MLYEHTVTVYPSNIKAIFSKRFATLVFFYAFCLAFFIETLRIGHA